MSSPPPLGMSTPPPPPAPPPAKSRKGCFIAVGVALVVVLLICLGGCLFIVKAPGRFMAMGLGQAQAKMVEAVASDVPDEQRKAFAEEFAAHVEWLRAITPETIKEKGEAFAQPAQFLQQAIADQSLSADEVEQFIAMSRALRGAPDLAPPPPPPAPAEEAPAEEAPAEAAPTGEAPVEGAEPAGDAPAAASGPTPTPGP